MHTACAASPPDEPGRRGFVRAVVGGGLAAVAGLPAAAAIGVSAPAAAEPGLPFHAWAPTPPMGWNSWDAFGASVTEAEYLDNARILAERLLPSGYDIATVDIQWYEAGATSSWYRPFAPLVLDAHGRPQPAPNRFPSAAGGRGFAPLAAQVHRLGLRFGVHLMRGIPRQAVGLELPIAGSAYRCHEVANPGSTCAWNTDMCGVNPEHPGAFDWYRAWFAQLAEWGVDFVKVDDIAAPSYHAKEVALIRRAIDATGRPMVLSLSPGPALLEQAAHLQAHANQWRVCNDFWDTWPQLRDNLANLVKWAPHARPGAWPDADMLPVGRIGLRNHDGDAPTRGERDTRFTRDEQVLMLTAWTCARSPLILGNDLRRLDDWTLRLVSNPEVLALLRVPGTREWHSTHQGHRFLCSGPQGHWAAWMNTGDTPWSAPLPAWLPDARRDCWARADLSPGTRQLIVPPHGARLVRCGPMPLKNDPT
ncbi:glycoside hydrolase family 27 protein [Aquabacterium humicola]|uniref:glycoside hydrolase family 27 protein n=1 Tax=Aquabacterium humicola TaxID=3237377 RepID=UPI0025438D71|nr:glycoside hydrolase family 27 protein [Rubrivivax pictus]